MPGAALKLADAIQRLQSFHGNPARPPTVDPFEMILFQNIAYLAPDDRRLMAFKLLRKTVGTNPVSLRQASTDTLEAIASKGILKSVSVEKLRKCGELAGDDSGAVLRQVVNGPVNEAKRTLRRFPGIGEPGAEKILLFAAGRPFLAPESNGLRVLVRLGFVREENSYAKTYAAARPMVVALGSEPDILQSAHLLLRLHGRTVCKNKSPLCDVCPLSEACAYAQAAVAIQQTEKPQVRETGQPPTD